MLNLSGSILSNADLPKLKEAATTFIERTMPEQGEGLYGTQEMAVYWFSQKYTRKNAFVGLLCSETIGILQAK